MCVCTIDARSAVESDRGKNRVCDVQYRWEYTEYGNGSADGNYDGQDSSVQTERHKINDGETYNDSVMLAVLFME